MRPPTLVTAPRSHIALFGSPAPAGSQRTSQCVAIAAPRAARAPRPLILDISAGKARPARRCSETSGAPVWKVRVIMDTALSVLEPAFTSLSSQPTSPLTEPYGNHTATDPTRGAGDAGGAGPDVIGDVQRRRPHADGGSQAAE